MGQYSTSVAYTTAQGWLSLAQNQENTLQYNTAAISYQKAIDQFSKHANYLESDAIEEEYWQIYLQLAKTLVKAERPSEAIQVLKKARRIIQNGGSEQQSLLGDVYYHLAEAQGINNDFWDALRNYRKAIELYEVEQESERLAKSYSMIGTIHQQLGDFNKAMLHYDRAASILQNAFSDDHPFFSVIYNNMGVVHAKLASYKEALSYFKKTQQIDERKGDTNELDLAGSYHNLGALYYLENDEERALEYLEHALQISKKHLGEQDLHIAQLYNDIGLIYRGKKQYKTGLSYFQRALHIYYKKLDRPNQDVAEIHHNIGLLYTEQGVYDLALEKLNETLTISKRLLPKEHFEFGKLYSNIGKVYFQQKNYRKSLAYYNQAQPIFEEHLGKHHPETVHNYNRLGEVYAAKGDIKIALRYYEKAIQGAIPSFLSKNMYHNPILKKDSIQLKYNLLNTLHQKAKTLYQLYQQENRDDHLRLAYETHHLVVDLLDIIRTDSDSEGARKKLINQTTGFYEAVVRIDFELYEKYKRDKYLQDAFTIIEKSKSTLLLEGIRDSEAKRYGGVEEELLKKEEETRVQLAFYKDRLIRLKQGVERSDTSEVRNKVRFFRTQHDSILNHLKEYHPKYYDYKYQSPDTRLQKVQSYLAKDELIIEYMWGANTLYTVGITKSGIEYHQQEIDSTLIDVIKRYRAAFELYQNNPEPNDQEFDRRLVEFKTDAHYLYQRLIAPILASIASDAVKNLIIIPDNYLGYISFETLLTSNAASQTSYRTLPYLLRTYDVRYDYSTALLLLADKKRELGRWAYMGFAPSYAKGNIVSRAREAVEPLKNNQPEVRDIRWQVGGHHVLGKEATEASFKKRAEDYRILHLAMHAFADDENPQLSRLVFAATQDSTEDGYLHVSELYNMHLKAELAVLSACDTGNGQVHPGEGVISLARAFKFAGCSNILMSLWKANDLTTKNIMVDFYKNLHDGKSKSIALRTAKLNYLDNPDNLRGLHPSFWATFVLIGSDAPVEIGIPFRLRYIVYGIGFFLFLGFYIFWERRVIDLVLDTPVNESVS